MTERIELNLAEFLSNQAADKTQKASQLLVEASNSFGAGGLGLADAKLDAGREQLERIKPIRSLIDLINQKIAEIKRGLITAGLNLPESYSLELKIVFSEQEEPEAKQTVR